MLTMGAMLVVKRAGIGGGTFAPTHNEEAFAMWPWSMVSSTLQLDARDCVDPSAPCTSARRPPFGDILNALDSCTDMM